MSRRSHSQISRPWISKLRQHREEDSKKKKKKKSVVKKKKFVISSSSFSLMDEIKVGWTRRHARMNADMYKRCWWNDERLTTGRKPQKSHHITESHQRFFFFFFLILFLQFKFGRDSAGKKKNERQMCDRNCQIRAKLEQNYISLLKWSTDFICWDFFFFFFCEIILFFSLHR